MPEIEDQEQNPSSEELPTITFAEENSTPMKVETPQALDISLEQLAKWKAAGNYELLEHHIRQGDLEILPKTVLQNLVEAQQELQLLVRTAQQLLLVIEPLGEKHEQLAKYIDPDSKFKINIGKLVEEILSVQNLNPFSKKPLKPLPIVQLFQDNVRTDLLMQIPLEEIEPILTKYQLSYVGLKVFLEKLGLWPVEEKAT